MTRASTSYASGRVQSGEFDLIFRPTMKPASPKPAILFGTSASGVARTQISASNTGRLAWLRALADAGYPIICGDFGGANTFGNATVQARLTAALAIIQASRWGAKSGGVFLAGVSMGGSSVLNWARNNKTSVLGIFGHSLVIDLDDIRNNDRSSLRASIDAGWAVTYPAALPAGANPALGAATLAGVPMRFYQGDADTICLPSITATYATAIGASATVITRAGVAHASETDMLALASGADLTALLAWLVAHGG